MYLNHALENRGLRGTGAVASRLGTDGYGHPQRMPHDAADPAANRVALPTWVQHFYLV